MRKGAGPRYQANQFVVYRSETAEYLYNEYTPLTVNYRPGLLPGYEALAKELTVGLHSDKEKAIALLKGGAARVKHPQSPPRGGEVRADRNLDDEALLQSRAGWCNEQARVFVRLCQVCNIPARIIHLWYSDRKSGHTVAEFYADGRWSMADATWVCVYPDANGHLLSAAQCHDGGEGQRLCGIVLHQRTQELLALSDTELGMETEEAESRERERSLSFKQPDVSPRVTIADWRKIALARTPENLADTLYYFAIINYPLPK